MTKRNFFLASLLAGTLVLAACSSASSEIATTTGSASDTAIEISIENFAFGPDKIVISVGDTVTWTNDESGIGHTTTSDGEVWDSKLLNPGDTFERSFDEAGTYSYFCSIHPSMTATITVSG